MINVTMEVNKRELKYIYKALDNLVMYAHKQFVTDGGVFNRRCAARFASKVVTDILNQRHAEEYQDYVRRYATWKGLMGLSGKGFWRLGGDLVKSLSHYRVEEGWFAGVAEGAMDRGGKSWLTKPGGVVKGPPKPISMYATVMEFGGDYGLGGVHPKRPVFVPAMEEFATNEWLEEANVALASIEKAWL